MRTPWGGTIAIAATATVIMLSGCSVTTEAAETTTPVPKPVVANRSLQVPVGVVIPAEGGVDPTTDELLVVGNGYVVSTKRAVD